MVILIDINVILDVVGISKEQVIAAIDNECFENMEDCLQAECAKAVRADYIITRNVFDFATSTTRRTPPDAPARRVTGKLAA